MSSHEKSVLEALKNGPKPRNELIEELCPEKMSEKKLQTTLNELADEEKIICRPKRIGESHKWTSVYALPKHRHLLEVDYSQVARAVKDLRLELCRNPDVDEVAAAIGGDPDNVRKTLFEHAPELRWRLPTPSEKEEAERSCEIARDLATIFKYGVEKDFDPKVGAIFWRDPTFQLKISAEDFERALFLLERRFESIKEEDIYPKLMVAAPGRFIGPSEPRERSKKEAIETLRKFSQN